MFNRRTLFHATEMVCPVFYTSSAIYMHKYPRKEMALKKKKSMLNRLTEVAGEGTLIITESQNVRGWKGPLWVI